MVVAVNGRKLFIISGLLRNSTIFRFAKNWDSDSARRKLPEMMKSLSRGLIVHRGDHPRRPSGLVVTNVNIAPGGGRFRVRVAKISGHA